MKAAVLESVTLFSLREHVVSTDAECRGLGENEQ
jgi:hypothetical protein